MPRDNNNNNDDDGTWRASGSGMASLIITINEAKNIKGTPGAQIGIRATISIPGNSKNKNANTTLSKQYSQRKQQDITLDHIFKIKPIITAIVSEQPTEKIVIFNLRNYFDIRN